MKKIVWFFIVGFSITINLNIYGQTKCNTEKVVADYIASNLGMDLLSLYQDVDFNPYMKFSYCDEEISIDYKRFGMLPPKQNSGKIQFKMKSLGSPLEESDHIIFHSAIENQHIMLETLVNRHNYLNDTRETTQFDQRKHFNGGLSYLFILDEHGCIKEVKKELSGYD